MNYEPGVGGAVFRHVQTAETCFFELSEPDVALYPWWLSKAAPETKLWGSEVPAQHRNGMFLPGSRSSLQSRRGRGITRDHRHMLHLFHSLLRSTFICLTYSLLGFSRGLFCCGLRNIFFVPPPIWNHLKCSKILQVSEHHPHLYVLTFSNALFHTTQRPKPVDNQFTTAEENVLL